MSVKDLLNDEVEKQLGSLEDLPFGSEEHHRGVQDTSVLLDKLNDMNRIEREYQEKEKCRIEEEDIRRREIRDARIERALKYGLPFTLSLIYVGVNLWLNEDAKKFEIDGYTHTTEAGRGSTRKLFGLLDKFK